jgi:hypothetical protein
MVKSFADGRGMELEALFAKAAQAQAPKVCSRKVKRSLERFTDGGKDGRACAPPEFVRKFVERELAASRRSAAH